MKTVMFNPYTGTPRHPSDIASDPEGRRAGMKPVAQVVPQWMPIEAAPKDGTEVLLSNGTDVSAGHWLHREGGIHERRDLEGRYIDQDEDEGYDGWIDWSGGMNPEPSHWMPLPAAPSAKEPQT